jgi:flagellar protein FliO/FliZ
MPSRRTLPSRTARTAATVALALLATLTLGSPPWVRARAADVTGGSVPDSPSPTRRPFPTREEASAGAHRGVTRPDGAGSGSWWVGGAGVAVALAVCGWLSVAAKRYRPGGVAGAAGLRVVGRTSLSPKHTVYLLQAGDRVLIVGTGPQGAPSLLGEMPTANEADSPAPGSRRLDVQLGDET